MNRCPPCAPPFEDLLAGVRKGDERAFATLWERFHPSLVRYLRVLARWESEDLASEVWLTVVRDLSAFAGDERGFRAWMLTIARRRVIDAARRRSRRFTDTVPLPDDDPAGDSDTVAEAAERMELDACLQRLRCLPPCQAEVVALRVIGGLSVTETAAMIGKSEGAVRVLAHRGLHQLRKQLSAEARRRWEESSSAA